MILVAKNKIRMGKRVILTGERFEDTNKKRIDYLLSVGAAEAVGTVETAPAIDPAPAPTQSGGDDIPDGDIVLEELTVNQLRFLAKEEGLKGYGSLSKADLVEMLAQHFGPDDGDAGGDDTGASTDAEPEDGSGGSGGTDDTAGGDTDVPSDPDAADDAASDDSALDAPAAVDPETGDK